MSHVIEAFLATDITCIPQIFDKYAGKYYSNKISNGATWVFLMWHVLHFVFEECVNLLLKKMKIREYVRVRLKQSIWYLGFYTMSFLYCTATLYKNNIDVFSHRKLLAVDNETIPGYLILGFVVLCTFYAHSIIWDGLKKGFSVSTISYLLLTVCILATYFNRKVELSLSLLAVVSFTQFGIELARCFYTLLKSESMVIQHILKVILLLTILLFVFTHLIIIPLFFVFPLMYSFIWDSQRNSTMTLLIILWLWLIFEIINNPLYKLCKHFIDHKSTANKMVCPGTAVECALFSLRDDDAYNMLIIREEMKAREEKMMALRKPKNRNMILQTLKCMVAIKKKLRKRRSSENSDSESEPSEEKSKNSDSGSEDEASEMDDDTTRLMNAKEDLNNTDTRDECDSKLNVDL